MWFGRQLPVASRQLPENADLSTAAASGRDDKAGSPDPRLAPKGGARTWGTHQTQALFGIVQGGMYPDLRRESAERTVEIDLPGYAIGGLSVGEPRPLTYEMVDAAIPYLPENKPRYLMGVGTPEEIVHYVAHGRGHDGLRAADAGGTARIAVYLGREAEHQERAVRQATKGRSIRMRLQGVRAVLAGLFAAPVCL